MTDPHDVPSGTAEEGQAGPQLNRIFVGLKMAPEIAASLAGLAERIESVPLRRVPENDIHLTLVPPWNETSIPAAVERLSKALAGFEGFFPLLRASVLRAGASPPPHAMGRMRGKPRDRDLAGRAA
jgi:hypothetical protein